MVSQMDADSMETQEDEERSLNVAPKKKILLLLCLL